MKLHCVLRFALLSNALLLATLCFAGLSTAQQPAEKPDTVMLTYHAKQGSEAELIRVIAKHWQKARDLKLVCDTPHIVVRGMERDGQPYFVEILTWRDGSIPDAPPAAIQSVWGELGNLVESRGGKSGIDIETVSAVDIESMQK